MDRASLTRRLESLPTGPGVYQYYDSEGRLIYVGKAVNLRNRVRSYFRDNHSSPKVARMVTEIADFKVTVVASELEALILECALIKAHHPRFNVKLRDDKQYPLIRVSTSETWPRVDVVRQRRDDGNAYFGPWADAGSVRRMLALLNRLFPFRTCPREINGNDPRPCLQFHIQRCLGPCIGAVSREEYRAMIDRLCRFLGGHYGEVVADLHARMLEASEARQFERAAVYRDQIRTIEKIMERQRVFGSDKQDADYLAFAREGDQACVVSFFVRDGRVIESATYPLANAEDATDDEALLAFLTQFYASAPQVPPEIVVPLPLVDGAITAEWIARTRGVAVAIRPPRDAAEQERLALVAANAREALRQMSARWLANETKTATALREIAEYLELVEAPRRIECYDIANTQGAAIVAAMVVFENGQPKRSHYRRFRIRSVVGPNDFASMHEVLERRFRRRRLPDGQPSHDPAWASLPDLVIVDGGRGQLSVAWETLTDLGMEGVTVVGLAKEHEEIFTVGQAEPILLPRTSESLYLVQRIRDETHRFVNAYHRDVRDQTTLHSSLDAVPGIGPKIRGGLLRAFGSLDAIRAASDEDLLAVKGMHRGVLAALREHV